MSDIDLNEDSKTRVSPCDVQNFGIWQEIVRRVGDPNLVFSDHPIKVAGVDYAGSVHYLLGRDLFTMPGSVIYNKYTAVKRDVVRERDNGKEFPFDPSRVYKKQNLHADYDRAMKGI